MELYRAVSVEEFQSITALGGMSCIPGSLEGKWFAEYKRDAISWGQRFYGIGNFHVITVEVEEQYANRFFRREKLDNIGPGRFADFEQMRSITIRVDVWRQ
jgi:hypothetical protein